VTTQTIDPPATPAEPGEPPPTPRLNAALAAAQAEMPPIAKGETGKISGTDKYGKPFSYEYSYADLSGLTAVAYPIFGKHGLSFSAQPTLTGAGKFILRYQLRHESGESLDGVMPLPSAAKPQDLGTILTYYRRYVFCAVTGIHPGGDDDDASSANNVQQYDRPQSAAEAFASAQPAPPRGQQARPPAAPKPPLSPPLEPGDEWKDAVEALADEDEATKLWAQVGQMLADGKIDKARADQLGDAMRVHMARVKARSASPGREAPAPDPDGADGQRDGQQPNAPARIHQEDQGAPAAAVPPAAADVAKDSAEAEFVRDFMGRLTALTDIRGVLPMQREIGAAIRDRRLTDTDYIKDLQAKCTTRGRELELAAKGTAA
jgi:hypothetical protein